MECRPNVHCCIDLVYRQTAVNRLHGLGSVGESLESLLVDVCRFYTGNLAFEVHDLRRRLLQCRLELLLLPEGGSCSCVVALVCLFIPFLNSVSIETKALGLRCEPQQACLCRFTTIR